MVACTGTATAATLITGKQIKNNSLTTKDVKNKSLRAGDFKPGDLPRGSAGATGAQGPQGAQGAQGAQGGPGLSGLETVSSISAFDSVSPKSLQVDCPEGKEAISAGYDISGGKSGVAPDTLLEVVADGVGTFGDQGFADAYETDPTPLTWSVSLSVLCARIDP